MKTGIPSYDGNCFDEQVKIAPQDSGNLLNSDPEDFVMGSSPKSQISVRPNPLGGRMPTFTRSPLVIHLRLPNLRVNTVSASTAPTVRISAEVQNVGNALHGDAQSVAVPSSLTNRFQPFEVSGLLNPVSVVRRSLVKASHRP